MLALLWLKKSLFEVGLEAPVVRSYLLSFLIYFICLNQVYAVKNDVFLEGIDNIVKLEFSDGSIYQGQVEECLIVLTKTTCMSGIGIYHFEAGSKYFGSFKGNKPSGNGLFIHLDGQTYEGNFKDGAINGKGIMTYPDGRRYDGNYSNNMRNGYGVMTYQDGRRYDGNYSNNMRNGYGVMTYQDRGKYEEGSSYEGEWLDDMRNGKGIMIYSNDGRRLKGEFKDNVFTNYN